MSLTYLCVLLLVICYAYNNSIINMLQGIHRIKIKKFKKKPRGSVLLQGDNRNNYNYKSVQGSFPQKVLFIASFQFFLLNQYCYLQILITVEDKWLHTPRIKTLNLHTFWVTILFLYWDRVSLSIPYEVFLKFNI